MPNTPINILSANPDENISGIHAGLHWTENTAQVYMAIPADVLREQLRLADEDSDDPVSEGTSLYFYTGPLTRYELNNSVKNFRRARDRVYGKDE
jgi:hypothetical protein